jgi:hypothetical protein
VILAAEAASMVKAVSLQQIGRRSSTRVQGRFTSVILAGEAAPMVKAASLQRSGRVSSTRDQGRFTSPGWPQKRP